MQETHILSQTNTANSQRLELGNAYSLITGGGGAVSAIASDDTLAFATADTERMRIDSSGDVGIGTSSPASTLHVNSDTTALQLTNSATGSAATDGFQIRHFSSSSGFVVIDQKEAAGVSFQIAGSERGALQALDTGVLGEQLQVQVLKKTGLSSTQTVL